MNPNRQPKGLDRGARPEGVTLSRWFLRIAVLWFVACVGLGAYMGATHRFNDVQAHVHGNLLGWVSCGLFALIHRTWPQLAATAAARVHFWAHNLGLLAFIAGLLLLPRGVPVAEPLLGVASVMLVLATAVFAIAVWRVTSHSASSAQHSVNSNNAGA